MKIIIELEKLLDSEINTYEEIENNLKEKREFLVKGDMEGLKKADERILEYNTRMEDIIKDRLELNKKLGSEGLTLSSIIKRTTDRSAAKRIEDRKNKINSIAKNIEVHNLAITELIKHALKLVEGSIGGLAQALNPQKSELATYSNVGRTGGNNSDSQLSSIVKEV